jgi:hypothetical protein
MMPAFHTQAFILRTASRAAPSPLSGFVQPVILTVNFACQFMDRTIRKLT